jgi:hypothetical protein
MVLKTGGKVHRVLIGEVEPKQKYIVTKCNDRVRKMHLTSFAPIAAPFHSFKSYKTVYDFKSGLFARESSKCKGRIRIARARGLNGVVCLDFATPEIETFPQQMFTLVNFAVLPFWGLMIAMPNAETTRKVMSSSFPILSILLIHLALVSYGLLQPGSAEEFQFLATQGFVKLSAMMEMRQFPVFVSEEWAHVLAWDLFVGRWIYLDGIKKNIPTPHSLFFCFLLGPFGLLLHFITRAVVKKDLSTLWTFD